MSMDSDASEPIGNFEQPLLAIADPESFGVVRSAVENSFAAGRVAEFLKALSGQGMRIRDFENVLRKGLLGEAAPAEYGRLGNADRGQIRELYLASLERVPAELRQRFFRLYAYY